jgi:Alkylmercury lyase
VQQAILLAFAVVFLACGAPGGPAAATCCGYLNFFPDAGTARAWARAHPTVAGSVAGQAEAERLGRAVFGPLLGGACASAWDRARCQQGRSVVRVRSKPFTRVSTAGILSW